MVARVRCSAGRGTMLAGWFSKLATKKVSYVLVLDLVSQIRDVVLARHTFSSGKPLGVGILEWGGDGEGMGMGRSVY